MSIQFEILELKSFLQNQQDISVHIPKLSVALI